MSDTRERHEPQTVTPEPVRRTRRQVRKNSAKITQASDEFIDPETGEPYRRHSEQTGEANPFHSVVKWFKPGWDYQFNVERVVNQQVDPSNYTASRRQGWRLVHPDEMPGEMPPDWDRPYIEIGAQRLYKRPMYLTKQARDEHERVSNQQVIDRYREADMTPPGTMKRLPSEIRQRMEPLPADVRASLYEDEVQEV